MRKRVSPSKANFVDIAKWINKIQSKAIFKLFDYVSLLVDEFALKAMVEQEDDSILISNVIEVHKFQPVIHKLQLWKLPLLLVLFMVISPFALLHDQFNT